MIENAPGPVAQLNRVSDSGSEGSGFEPQRDHEECHLDGWHSCCFVIEV